MKDEIDWLHRFLNASVFGPPPSEIQRAHEIVDRLVSPEGRAIAALKVVRAMIRREQIEHAIVDMQRPDVGLGAWLDEHLPQHSSEESK